MGDEADVDDDDAAVGVDLACCWCSGGGRTGASTFSGPPLAAAAAAAAGLDAIEENDDEADDVDDVWLVRIGGVASAVGEEATVAALRVASMSCFSVLSSKEESVVGGAG